MDTCPINAREKDEVDIVDLASIIGLILGIFFFVASIVLNGGVSSLGNFMDAASVMIVVGGCVASVMITFPMNKFVNGLKGAGLIFKDIKNNEGKMIQDIIQLSNIARKEGLLALEEAANSVNDNFLKKGILLIVDGTDPELVRNILETEIIYIEERHGSVQTFWAKVGELGPAWGMIGTLIGLVNMLKAVGGDSSAIGPAMAVALITTLYGSLLANFIAIPFASKLKIRSTEEMMVKEVMVEGLLSIQAGENPRVIEEKLKAFLSPKMQSQMAQENMEAGE